MWGEIKEKKEKTKDWKIFQKVSMSWELNCWNPLSICW